MVFLSQHFCDQLIQEDVPYFDLTTHLLGIGTVAGHIHFQTRQPTCLAGIDEAALIFKRLGASVTYRAKNSECVAAKTPILRVEGEVALLQKGWKVAQNLLEYACGVATQTRDLVQRARTVNPKIMLYTTRKTIPGSKPIAIAAILAGGAYPHRLGLSETILIFQQHLNCLDNKLETFLQRLPQLKAQAVEKKIIVEVKTATAALQLAEVGVDGLQLDKFSYAELKTLIPQLKAIHPALLTLATGGIERDNIADYAATAVEGLVLTAPYYAKPADIGVEILPASRDNQGSKDD
jgi:molybdenum transport protein